MSRHREGIVFRIRPTSMPPTHCAFAEPLELPSGDFSAAIKTAV